MAWVSEISIDTAPTPSNDLHLHEPMAHVFLRFGDKDDDECMEG
jgi:hypothetical protein